MKKIFFSLSIFTLQVWGSVPYCPPIEEILTHDSTFYCDEHDKKVLKLIIQDDCTALLHHFKEKLPPLPPRYINCLKDFIVIKNTLMTVKGEIDNDQIHDFLSQHKKQIGTFKYYGDVDMLSDLNKIISKYHPEIKQ